MGWGAIATGGQATPPQLRQGDALGGDHLPPIIFDVLAVDEIYPVGEIAVTEGLAELGKFIQRQWPAGIDCQIEIRVTPGSAGHPRAEHPHLGAQRQIGTKNIQHQLFVFCRQVDV
jgi:hypothetical protein